MLIIIVTTSFWIDSLLFLFSTDTVSCQPRPYIINKQELTEALRSSSSRIQSYASTFEMKNNCIQLHRCSKYGGCCYSGGECSMRTQETVSIDIEVSVSRLVFTVAEHRHLYVGSKLVLHHGYLISNLYTSNL